MKTKVVSMFSGCGGMDLGTTGGFSFLGKKYDELPFEIVYACDNDPYAGKMYVDNFAHPFHVMDVNDLDVSSLPDHDLLIGGFPCQSFSISATNPPRLGYKDSRGQLFFRMIDVLKAKRPRFFIAENVKGIKSANKGKAFPMILSEFRDAGYEVTHMTLNASDFGVPQKRERVFIVGFREINDFFAYHPFPPSQRFDDPRTLGMVIDEDANKDQKWFFSEDAVAGMLRANPAMNKGRIQSLDGPCNTVTSHLAKVTLNSTDPVLMVNGKYRRFTPREVARIQSFPESFKLGSVSESRQYKAIGNAVPPVLMWHVVKVFVKTFRMYL